MDGKGGRRGMPSPAPAAAGRVRNGAARTSEVADAAKERAGASRDVPALSQPVWAGQNQAKLTAVLRRRIEAPTMPMPAISMAQLAGSGTEGVPVEYSTTPETEPLVNVI